MNLYALLYRPVIAWLPKVNICYTRHCKNLFDRIQLSNLRFESGGGSLPDLWTTTSKRQMARSRIASVVGFGFTQRLREGTCNIKYGPSEH
eukprot:scaffold13805_cov23-Cyclotella_meneghiniana.AAC.1